MESFVRFLFDTILATLLKVVGIVLTLAVLLQIFSRYIMIHPFSWTEELSRFSFIWFCFLGSAYTLRQKLHLGIDYFYLKFGPRMRLTIDLVINTLVLFFGGMLISFGSVMMSLTTFQKSPILRLNMSNMYMVLPVTGFFFVVFSIHQLLQLLRRRA